MVELTMSQENNQLVSQNHEHPSNDGFCCMESVNRVYKLPVVETTVQTASNIYTKLKDFNSITNWTLSTAESTVNKAIEVSKPITTQLEGPIKKVDQILCTGLDFVEDKVPAVKLPAGELYTQTKTYVEDTYTNKVQPAVEMAKHNVVEPALEKASALKDYGTQKVTEILNNHNGTATSSGTPPKEETAEDESPSFTQKPHQQ